MRCCGNCVGDPHLLRRTIPERRVATGACDYCAGTNLPLVNASDLRDEFELLLSIYVSADNGRPILSWLREDWAMFDVETIAEKSAEQLLIDILEDAAILERRFAPSAMCRSDSLDRWQQFRHELMYANRFFPDAAIDLERLKGLLPHLLLHADDIPEEWFRARIQQTEAPFTREEMGAPPKQKALHGRANPAGIPYLYLASTAATSVSEVRPHTGEFASVAHFKIAEDLKLVDLRDPRRTVSPFILDDEFQIAQLRADTGFLELLGQELTRPVVPRSAAIDYIPSQYLCELIKKSGFDGVMYRSSVDDGMNIALFDSGRAAMGEIERQRVARVTVELEAT